VNRIGIFGGTFDPIHYGHLIISQQAKEQFELSTVVFIPCGDPYHKKETNVSSKEHRLNMVKIAIEDNQCFEISDIEIKREGETYAIDTLRELKSGQYKNDLLFYVIGSDIDISSWKDYKDVFELTEFIKIHRISVDTVNNLDIRQKEFVSKIHYINDIFIGISSTDIRNKVKQKKSIKYFVPDVVEKYIIKNNLYINEIEL